MKQRKRGQAKKSSPKHSLNLPDLDQSRSAVLNSLPSKESQRGYRHAIDEFIEWYCSEPRLSFNKAVVTRYRIHLESRQLAPNTINGRLAVVRRLAYEAADSGLLSPDLAAGIRRVKGAKCLGVRLGNWLTATQARALWQVPDPSTLKGKRDRALLGILLGCGLRRREAAELEFAHIQQREDHWAIVDLVGKGRHIRTVPVPDWVKAAIDSWCESAGVNEGRVFRCVCRAGKTWGTGVTERVVWHVVKNCAKRAGIDKLAPHDLRRYAESRTMPNQDAARSLPVCDMDAAGHRLLRTMRHSPVVARLGEELNRGPSGRQPLSSPRARSFKNWLLARFWQ